MHAPVQAKTGVSQIAATTRHTEVFRKSGGEVTRYYTILFQVLHG